MNIKSWNRYKSLKRKNDENKKKLKNDYDTVLTENINGLDTDIKGFIKFQHRILGVLKCLFILPSITLFTKVAGKFLMKKVPDKPYFNNYKLEEKAFEIALRKWYDVYNQDAITKNPVKRMRNFLKGYIPYILKRFMWLKNTLLFSDSAYFEFYNIFLMEKYKVFGDYYKGVPVHVLYKNKENVNDPIYFVAVNEGNTVLLRKRIESYRHYFDDDDNLKSYYVGGSKSKVLEMIANELDCVPNKMLLLNKLNELKNDNNHMKQVLLNINNNSVVGLQGEQKDNNETSS